jgi:hypothetical protein
MEQAHLVSTAGRVAFGVVRAGRSLRCLGVLLGLGLSGGAHAAAVPLTAAPFEQGPSSSIASISSVSPGGEATGLLSDLPLITTTLYDGTTLYAGVNFTQFELDVPSEGTLRVKLEDLAFPALAGSLSFALVRDGTVLDVLNGSGSFERPVAGAVRLFAYVYAVAAPGINIGSHYLNVTHETVIPLPAAFWLLAGGLGLLGWVGRRRAGATSA